MSRPPVPPRPSEYEPTIVSPRPHRTDNPAADLDQLAPPSVTFSMPAPFAGGPVSAPAVGPGSDWSPWAFTAPPRSPFPNPPPAPPTPAMPAQQQRPSPSPSTAGQLTAALPSIPTLLEALPSITAPGLDGNLKITWARDVFFLADRAHHLHLQLTTPVGQAVPSVSDPIVGPMPLASLDFEIVQLISAAVPLVLELASPFPPGVPYQQNTRQMEPFEAEAVYMRAVLTSTGAHPNHIAFNPKAAFRDFEAAARGGYAGAWFRLGRDYETFGDFKHAKECFERGAKLGVESCLYRLGMAHLLGQLTLPANVNLALPILQRAAVLASLECPQPAYVYSLLLLSEFASIPPIPPQTFASLSAIPSYPPPSAHPSQPLQPLIPLGSSPHLESRHHLERAAYLHYGPAQYKLGHAYEFADPPFFFDPLLSVQYYSLASQNGEVEADMALSKWFLCGSSGSSTGGQGGKDVVGGFEKDEALALTFAQKAAARNLPSAHFAMGYYAEVGIGRAVSIPDALHHYALAAQHGNTDAQARLDALNTMKGNGGRLEKGVHEQRVERSRTMAQRRTEETPMSPPFEGRTFGTMREEQRRALAGALAPPASQSQQQSQSLHPNQQPVSAGGLRPPTSAGGAGGGTGGDGRNGQFRAQRDPRAVVELARKGSVATYLPLRVPPPASSSSSANGPPSASTSQQYQQQNQQQQYQQNQQQKQHTTHTTQELQQMAAQGRTGVGSGRMPGLHGLSNNVLQQQSHAHASSPLSGRPSSAGGHPTHPTHRPTSSYPGRYDSPSQGSGASTPTGGYGGGGGGGGRRPQSPGRANRTSASASPGPGLGRMGKLSVDVDGGDGYGGYGGGGGVPPVPALPSSVAGTPALPNTAHAGHTPRPPPTATTATAATPGGQGGGGGKHPATFAEMGIQGAKAEDKDCVVM